MGGGEGCDIRPRSRHCNRLKSRKPGYPPCCGWRNSSRERESQKALRDLVGLFVLHKNRDLRISVGYKMKDGVLRNEKQLLRAALAMLFVAASFAISLQARSQGSAAPASREFTDEVGRTVRIPQPERRIVSIAPSLTDMVHAL